MLVIHNTVVELLRPCSIVAQRWFISTSSANLVGIGRSTACERLHSFCKAIVDVFFQRLVKFPATNQEVQETIEEFLL